MPPRLATEPEGPSELLDEGFRVLGHAPSLGGIGFFPFHGTEGRGEPGEVCPGFPDFRMLGMVSEKRAIRIGRLL